MKTMSKWASAALAGALAVSACASESAPAMDPTDQEKPAAGKADCPDCDDTGPGALVQAGLYDGFYEAGHTWRVAWQFTQRTDMEMKPVLHVDPLDLPAESSALASRSVSDVFLFDYAVLGTAERIFTAKDGTRVKRQVATIRIAPGDPAATAHQEVFSAQEIGRFEPKFVFELNDLLEPVAETIFSRTYPNGRRIEVDSVSRLATGSSLFPHAVPRVLTGAVTVFGDDFADRVSPEVAAAADAFAPGWRSRTYNAYTFEGKGEIEGQGDVVAWAKGDLWPFYVKTDQGEGVLVEGSFGGEE
jgi:hypothetical protein